MFCHYESQNAISQTVFIAQKTMIGSWSLSQVLLHVTCDFQVVSILSVVGRKVQCPLYELCF